MTTTSNDQIRQAVRENYGQIAEVSAGCCDTSCCTPDAQQPELLSLQLGYTAHDLIAVPEGANLGLGCGNPGPSRTCRPARPCSTWAAALASTASSPPAKSAPRGP